MKERKTQKPAIPIAAPKTRNEKAIRIAKNLIEQGQLSLELIAQATELPLEKIQELAGVKTA